MYVITSNISGTAAAGRSATGAAETIPAALGVFAGQLRRALPLGGVRWTIVDPTGTEHPGHITLNGRVTFSTAPSTSCAMSCTSSCTAWPTATAASDEPLLTAGSI